MPKDNFDQDEINKLIKEAMSGDGEDKDHVTLLRSLFNARLAELEITINQAVENLEMEYRTLNGILDGTLERLDAFAILKVAQFLDMQYTETAELYISSIALKRKDDLAKSKVRNFILEHFDLPVLKSLGIISSIRDFEQIEEQLKLIFHLQSITDYDTQEKGAAYSSTTIKPKNEKTRQYFISKSKLILKLINNPNAYNKQGLIEYFQKIRWHSTDVDNGLINVIKSVFDLGLTVIFQPTMPSLQLRGATFSVNEKPCIVLTDYRNSYPTIWFAFLHELFHVLFDWEEISQLCYHLSDEENDLFVLRQKEEEANDFAREYLFPQKKMELISNKILQKIFIRDYALENHVHHSIIYANFAYSNNKSSDNNLWAQFDKFMPSIKNLVKNLSGDLSHKTPAQEFANFYKNNIFNFK